jgi:hypothetical protein
MVAAASDKRTCRPGQASHVALDRSAARGIMNREQLTDALDPRLVGSIIPGVAVIAADSYAPRNAPTIYDVLAARARSHRPRFLATQATLTGAAGLALLVVTLPWWPLAALFLSVSAYSAWGLIDARERERGPRRWARALAAALVVLATAGAAAAVAGMALAAFTGDRPGPYGACSDAPGHTFACDAKGARADPRGPR